MTLDSAAITQNHAYQGAGIVNHVSAFLTITNSTVAGNTANSSAVGSTWGGGSGGAASGVGQMR